ncbi:hypothetical protein L1887_18775 [Cichorium endivia]|nr:hypothetical protein L1887_18775 [Cichorium endivia]
MEVALQEGLAKNPDCPELLEWVEKKNELFNEESWKDGGVAEDSTERSPSHGFDSGDDEMGERELSPITGVITEGVGKNEDICFKTPIGQPVNDSEDLTMTQFLEIRGVLDTVNKLVDDTVELSAEKQSKAKEDEVPDVRVRNLNDDLMEAIQQEVADKKGKRPVKIPKHLHSPFMQRIVRLDERIMPDELSVCNVIFASQRDYGDAIWEDEEGNIIYQGNAYHFKDTTFIHWSIIECWAAHLNKMEAFKSTSSPARLFFNSEDSMFDDNVLEVNRSRDFGDYLRLYISNLPI